MSGIEDLARKGRNGDNTLMHVSTDEVAGLNSLARSMMGRELTQNPDTDLPEAFLFAPLLAPMAASGLGLGGGALATGLLAGGLGAAEAELRGMDDPLERGLYSGLTAGALSGVGNALSGAGEAGQAAGQAGEAGSQAATASGGSDLSQSVQGGASAGNMQSVPQQSFPGSDFTPPPSAGQASSNLGLSQPAPSGLTQPSSGGGFGFDANQAVTGSQYGDIPQMAQGAKNIFTDTTGEAGRQFMSQAQMPIAAGAAGLGGQAQMRARDEMKERAGEAKAEKEADRRQAENQIRSSYAAVGRPMPTPIGGGSLFQRGGIVGLRRGGSTNPGVPGGESGTRGVAATGGASGSGGRNGGNNISSGSNQAPQKEEEKELFPFTPSGTPIRPEGINSFLTALQSGAGNQAAMQQSGYTGAVGTQNAPVQTTQPTTPTMRTEPSQARNMFLDELQQGAGNRMAMQNSGYRGGMGMAEGGYLDGGVLPGDGMSDDVPASIDGEQPAALSSGEFVIPADVVSHIGNGSSDSGAKELYAMMDRIRKARTGDDDQAPPVNARKMMPK